MTKNFQLIYFIFVLSFGATDIANARKYDATLSYIIYDTGSNDEKSIIRQFAKNFSNVQPFIITKKTNFYLRYILTDDNFIQYEITKRDNEDITGEDTLNKLTTGQLGSAKYEAYKRDRQFNVQFSSGRNEIKASIVSKPYKGTMVLYNSYGSELIRVESKDHYKTTRGALKNTITQMRRTIDRQNDKMAIKQKSRCLFCDYNNLKDRQKKKILNIAYMAHSELLNQLYGEINETELPVGLVPYANIYSAQKKYKLLENIVDTNALIFDNQPGTRRLPGHLINELIKADAPEGLIEKIAAAYKKNKFQVLDKNNHTPLWSAIFQKDTGLVKKLISLGVDVNQVSVVNNSYLTPLMVSAQFGTIEITKTLLHNGAIKELTTPSGFTAWSTAMWLAQYDHADLLWPSELNDLNSIEAQNLLIQAAYFGQYKKVKELLALGVPVYSRGIGGDNIVVSAIKGIKTFAIEADFIMSGATSHNIDSQTYWDIIDEAEKAGLENPITSSTGNLRQTVLFYAYPDGSNKVSDDHLKLISRLIQKGVDPKTSNVNGQNADQVYQQARLAYLDGLYESELGEINQGRKKAAQLAQIKQQEAKETALETITARGSSMSRSQARSSARRLEAIERLDQRARRSGFASQTSNFTKDTSDVDQIQKTDTELQDVNKKIRETYAYDLRIASEIATRKKEELGERVRLLKLEEENNALTRLADISKVVQEQ